MTSLQSEDCQTNDLNDLFPMSIESLRFPLDNSMRIIFTGYFNGYNVELRSADEIALLFHMGCFGKGSASRSQPVKNNKHTQIMRKRQFVQRNNWFKKFGGFDGKIESDLLFKELEELTTKITNDGEKAKKKDVIDLVSSDEDSGHEADVDNINSFNINDKEDIAVVVPNSDSEEENYFSGLRPHCCVNRIKMPEKLILTLEEAFFLIYGLGCLQVVNKNHLMNIEQCWTLFHSINGNFTIRYVVYHYFRSKGYVVKSGIKFGGDYLLYKDGPTVRHADYIVLVRPKDRTDIDNWVTTLGHMRMATTTVKELLLVEVIEPKEKLPELPRDLNLFEVQEMLLTRKIPMTVNNDD